MSFLSSTIVFSRVLSIAALLSYPILVVEGAWSTPVAISTSISDQPDIALDGSGNAVLVWQGFDDSNYVIQAANLPKGGSWSAPYTLSESGQNAQSPSVGVDANGNAVTIWSRYDGWNSMIQGSTQPYQGNWSVPVNVSETGQNADSPKIAMDNTGTTNNAVAVWHRYNGFNFIMQSSSLPSGGDWSAPASISVSGQDALVPVVAVDPEGNAAAVCSRFDGANFTSRAAAYLSNQTWSSSFIISTPGATASQQTIGMDSNGNSIIAWSYYDGAHNVIQVSTLHFGDGWTAPITISTQGQDSYIPQVAVDAAGNAIVIWVGFDGVNYVAQAATFTAGGSWSAPVILSQDGADVNNVSIAINSAGNAVAVWDKTNGVDSIIEAAALPKGGSWSTPVTISTPGSYAYLPVVDVDPVGNAAAAWLQFNGTTYVVYGASLSS